MAASWSACHESRNTETFVTIQEYNGETFSTTEIVLALILFIAEP